MKFTPEELVNVTSSSGVAMVLEVVLLRAGMYLSGASEGCPLVSAQGGVAAAVTRVVRAAGPEQRQREGRRS
jgi:hypothetical protein